MADIDRRMWNYEFTGFEYIGYYLTLWIDNFAAMPFVVKTCVTIIVMSIFMILIVMFQMFIALHKDRKEEKFFNEISEKYTGIFKEIITSPDHYNKARINELLGPVPKRWKGWRMLFVGRLIVKVKYDNYEHYNHPNLQNLITLTGLRTYLEKTMTFGSLHNRLLGMEQVYYLLINLPESILVRLLSSRYTMLRKQVRLYYIFLSDFNPFRFITDQNINHEHCPIDEMELHHLLRARKMVGKELPSLLPIIEKANDPNAKASMIREVAYWGNKEDEEKTFKFITSRHDIVKIAVIQGIGISKNEKGEKVIMDHYNSMTEDIKQRALYAIFRIKSGKAVDFYVEQFKASKVAHTRLKTLLCLMHYNQEGAAAFQKLNEEASSESDKKLFEQVKGFAKRFKIYFLIDD